MATPRQYGRVIVLHAAWLTGSGRLALWAEGGNGRSTPGPRRRPARRIPPHPFALDPEGLRLAVSDIAGIAAADLLGEDVKLTLQLPDADGVPIASAPDDERPGGPPGGSAAFSSSWEDLSLWTAPGYVVDPSAASKFLRSMPLVRGNDRSFTDAGPSDVELGPDIRFAAHAIEMVVELLARGRLLPDLEFVAGHWRACWRPLIEGHDRGRIEALAWALPASFVAVRVPDSNSDDSARSAGTRTQRRGHALADVGRDGRSRPRSDHALHAEGPETGCRSDRRRCLAACSRFTRRLPPWVRGRRVRATGRAACRVARHEECGGRSGTDLLSDRPSPR